MKFIQVRLAIAVLLFCGNAIASCTGLKGHDDHNQLEITTAYGVKHNNVAGFGPGDKSLRTRDLGCMEVPLVVDTVVRYKSTDMNPIHNSLKQQSLVDTLKTHMLVLYLSFNIKVKEPYTILPMTAMTGQRHMDTTTFPLS